MNPQGQASRTVTAQMVSPLRGTLHRAWNPSLPSRMLASLPVGKQLPAGTKRGSGMVLGPQAWVTGFHGPETDRWTRPNICTPCVTREQNRAHFHGHPPVHLAWGSHQLPMVLLSGLQWERGLKPQQPHLCPHAEPGIPTH